jgi:hypothetical protein
MNKASERQKRYDDKTARRYQLKLHKKYDKAIIERLAAAPSMQGYIRDLIRQDMARDEGRFRTYAIIDMGVKDLNFDVVDLDYKQVFTSQSIGAILDKLEELNADDDHFSIEEYTATEDGDFIEGSDYDTPSNFKKRMGWRKA